MLEIKESWGTTEQTAEGREDTGQHQHGGTERAETHGEHLAERSRAERAEVSLLRRPQSPAEAQRCECVPPTPALAGVRAGVEKRNTNAQNSRGACVSILSPRSPRAARSAEPAIISLRSVRSLRETVPSEADCLLNAYCRRLTRSFCAAAQATTLSRYAVTRSGNSATRSRVSPGSSQTSNSRDRRESIW